MMISVGGGKGFSMAELERRFRKEIDENGKRESGAEASGVTVMLEGVKYLCVCIYIHIYRERVCMYM